MTREEAFANCPSDSYVEFYGNQWLTGISTSSGRR